ncbi:nitrate ABC transporter permease [Asticcacaulis machinosus]|uniref:Nitrate ABC transporter permease n=1 Tax=Asticcacaulis machinosus TaxID=2984211 RepID=A0ABT5HJE8_9CAUL|nr:nitrate ABC transporter permease [Asticcacaulis machinosus]MDC7676370.1 nitrate ABC transporter permease [Asticcacaulis machinosus]
MPFEVQKMPDPASTSTHPTAAARATIRDPIAVAQQKQINAAKLRKFADKVATWLMPALTIAAFLLIWEVISNAFPGGLPAPSMVLLESQELIFNPFYDRGGVDKGLFWHVMTSLSRVGIGFGLAAIAGVLLGAFIGTVDLARKGLDPIFQVFRTVPPLAWLPISLAALREAEPSALFVIFITSIWPIVINTAVGVRNIPQDYLNVAKVLRLHPVEFFFQIMLPAATPHIFTGLRIGVGMSWLAIVASEMLLGGVGIGFFIWDQYNSSRMSDIIVALMWVGMVGFILDRLVAMIGQYVSRGTTAD